jgi:predicted component of type VI protein secretion system
MKLVIEDEAGTRSVVPFAEDAIVVGRGSEDVTFRLGDRNVSRRHARFLRQSGAVFVEDLGSQNGTRVNGERITGKRRLRDGDLVQIGDYDLAILAEGAPVAPGAPPPLPAGPRPGSEGTTQRFLISTADVVTTDAGATPAALAAPAPAPVPAVAPAARNGRRLRLALALVMAALVAGLIALATRGVTPP